MISPESAKLNLMNSMTPKNTNKSHSVSEFSGLDDKTRSEDDLYIEKNMEKTIEKGLCGKFAKCFGFLLKLQ